MIQEAPESIMRRNRAEAAGALKKSKDTCAFETFALVPLKQTVVPVHNFQHPVGKNSAF